jgi:hypothetical protein
LRSVQLASVVLSAEIGVARSTVWQNARRSLWTRAELALTGLFVARVLVAVARLLVEIGTLALEQANTARAHACRLACIGTVTKAFSVEWQWNFLANADQTIARQRMALWCLFVLAIIQIALADDFSADLLANIVQCALIAIVARLARLWSSVAHTRRRIARITSA